MTERQFQKIGEKNGEMFGVMIEYEPLSSGGEMRVHAGVLKDTSSWDSTPQEGRYVSSSPHGFKSVRESPKELVTRYPNKLQFVLDREQNHDEVKYGMCISR